VFTYTVGRAPDGDTKLVLTIADDGGRQVRRLDIPKTTGVNRMTWNLRGDVPAGEGRGGAGGRGGAAGGRGGGAGAGGAGGGGDELPAVQGFGRGGAPQGPAAAPGRYRATLGRQTGETVAPIGQTQTFLVLLLPR
jgi:hypothetical protein